MPSAPTRTRSGYAPQRRRTCARPSSAFSVPRVTAASSSRAGGRRATPPGASPGTSSTTRGRSRTSPSSLPGSGRERLEVGVDPRLTGLAAHALAELLADLPRVSEPVDVVDEIFAQQTLLDERRRHLARTQERHHVGVLVGPDRVPLAQLGGR